MNAKIEYGTKKLYFMRHGRAEGTNSNFENIKFEYFMSLMKGTENPPLVRENHNIVLPFPYKIDVIYPSLSRRAIETAQLIQASMPARPLISKEFASLLAEVKFLDGIVSESEFKPDGGFDGIRSTVLERWFHGKYTSENFYESMSRVQRIFAKLTGISFGNVLFVTHGLYLRAIYLYLTEQSITLENILKSPLVSYGNFLKIGNSCLVHDMKTKNPEDFSNNNDGNQINKL